MTLAPSGSAALIWVNPFPLAAFAGPKRALTPVFDGLCGEDGPYAPSMMRMSRSAPLPSASSAAL